MGSPGPRRRAREIALQILYAAEAGGSIEPRAVERAYCAIVSEFSLPTRAR
jgi:N utilization substance protein B